MSFTYSAIVDNTKENREHLEKLGYKPWVVTNRDYLYTKIDSREPWFSDAHMTISEHVTCFINCIGNPQLFQAVTAMRDYSDELQYFTDGSSWLKVPIGYDLVSFLYADWDGDFGLDYINKWHKASLSELQEYFK